jgi:hypothetical protein
VFGVARRGEAEQRVDRRESGVTGAHAVVPIVFEVVEERGDQVAVDVVDLERGWLLAGLRGGEADHSLQVSR